MTGPGACRRLAEAEEGVSQLGNEIDAWITSIEKHGKPGAYRTQLLTLRTLFTDTLKAITSKARPRPGETLSLGQAYDRARLVDKRVVFCRRLFHWYAARFDQRRLEELRSCLAGADELVWSTWARTFEAAGIDRPPVPLPFIDNDAVPWASFHDALPTEARPPSVDSFFKDRVRELPIPVIGLPPVVARRPWWLVVAVHETGHHVQHTLHDQLVDDIKEAVRLGATGNGGPASEAQLWEDWSEELFADVYAAAFAGDASLWAIEELERAPAETLVKNRDTYPPAVVRLEVAAAAVEATGGPRPAIALVDGGEQVDTTKVADLIKRAPHIAGAILDAPLGATTLRGLAPSREARSEAQAVWASEFETHAPAPAATVEAAVSCVGGAVQAWRRASGNAPAPDPGPLRERVLAVLPECRVDGDRAAVSATAGRVTALIASILDPEAPL